MSMLETIPSGVNGARNTGADERAYFPLIIGGKTPAVKAWETTKIGVYAAEGNYGIVLTAEDLVLDADPRNYPAGRDVMMDLLKDFKLPETYVVKTAGGGYHFYFKKPADLKIRKKQALFPGIDFLSEGAYVVGPGSVVNGLQYSAIVQKDRATLPKSFLDVLERCADRLENGTEVSLAYAEQFRVECQTAAPAIEGQAGDETTYKMACRGRDLALPSDLVYELMRDHFNPRCLPPWSESDLYQKVTHAYRYAKNAPGASTAEAKFMSFAPDPSTLATSANNGNGSSAQEEITLGDRERKLGQAATRWPDFSVPHGYVLADTGLAKEKPGKATVEPICGPIAVVARTRGVDSELTGGIVIELWTLDNKLQSITIPRNRLHMDGRLLAQDLASLNFSVVPGQENTLLAFLDKCRPEKELVACSKTGWAAAEAGQEKLVFVFPERSTDESYRFQPDRTNTNSPIKERGTMEEWTQQVLFPIASNPFALYEIFKSLSAPLQKFAGIEIGGEHLYG